MAGPAACVRGGVTRTPARRKRQADPVRPRESSFAAKHLQIAEREQRLQKKFLSLSLAVALASAASLSRPDGGPRRRLVVVCAASNSQQGTAAGNAETATARGQPAGQPPFVGAAPRTRPGGGLPAGRPAGRLRAGLVALCLVWGVKVFAKFFFSLLITNLEY